MKLALALTAVVTLVLALGADAMQFADYPDSTSPVWLSNDLIRFKTNLRTQMPTYEDFVVAPDGTGLRPATAEESAARPASSSNVSPDRQTIVVSDFVGWAYAQGHVLYAAPTDGSVEPVRLTPTPCTLSSATHSALRGRCFDGTDGPDSIVGTRFGDIVIGGSGSDTIHAGDGQNQIEAQWGDDEIRSGSGPDWVWAGPGNDTVATGAGSDRVYAGTGHDTISTGSGVDYVYANDGVRDVIDCGPGDDRVLTDGRDVLRHCEHVILRAGPEVDLTP